MLKAKKAGFADAQIERYTHCTEEEVRKHRKKLGVAPFVKQIDTLSAEFPAKTNYLYLTYHGDKNDLSTGSRLKKKTIILGSGPYCIGSSVEFDWCGVNALNTFKKEKFETIMINYNPETVSTDYDICDKLYFDELSLERVLDICEYEKPLGVLLGTGGQIPNNLAMKLYKNKIKIWGTNPVSIDSAENRHKFSALLDKLNIDQPVWKEFSNVENVYNFAEKIGYPVLVRPSYVLSGAAMSVAKNSDELKNYLDKAVRLNKEVPVVISKFEKGAKEIEIDGVAHKGNLLIWAIAEHVENAGVHSGDATIVLPPQKLYLETIKRVKNIAKQISSALKITGPFNIQFLAKNNAIKVIECNLRASRSFPFSSKVTGHNFIEIAVKAMLSKVEKESVRKQKYRTLELDYVGVKAPQFSFPRLSGADPMLSIEMASTGEVACFGETLEEAFLKAFISVGGRIPQKNILLSIGSVEDKASFLSSAKNLKRMGFNLYGTENTSKFLNDNNAACERVYKASEKKHPNIIEMISEKKADLVINIPKTYAHDEMTDGYFIRRTAVDNNIPLITNLQIAKLFARAIEKYKLEDLEIKEWREYV